MISVHKLCKDMKCSMTFIDNLCYIQDPSQTKPQQLGSLRKGLFYLDEKYLLSVNVGACCGAQSSNEVPTVNSSVDNVKLWLLRLGHLPFNHQLNKVKSDLDVKCCVDSCICQV